MAYNQDIFRGAIAGVTINDFVSKLDYKITSLSERRKLLYEELYPNGKTHDFFVEFFEPRFEKGVEKSHFKSIKTTSSPLSENNNVCQALERMGTYLLFAPDLKKDDNHRNIRKEVLNSYKKLRNSRTELSYDEVANILAVDSKEDVLSILLDEIIEPNKFNYKFEKTQKIFQSDFSDPELPALKDYERVIKRCTDKLNWDKLIKNGNSDQVPEEHRDIKLSITEISQLRKMIRECKTDMLDYKTSVKGTIYAKFAEDSPVPPDYITFCNFTNLKHMRELLKLNPRSLKSDIGHILYDLDQLIKKINLTEFEENVLKLWRIEDETEETIAEALSSYQPNVNRAVYSIAKKVIRQYELEKQDWLYLNYIKGEYRQCKECQKVKLIQHFQKDAKSPDGRKSKCKVCRSTKDRE